MIYSKNNLEELEAEKENFLYHFQSQDVTANDLFYGTVQVVSATDAKKNGYGASVLKEIRLDSEENINHLISYMKNMIIENNAELIIWKID